MSATANKEQLQERAQLIRALEASCQIDHPSDEERNFRIATMKQIGVAFGMKEVRDKQITGPGNGQKAK